MQLTRARFVAALLIGLGLSACGGSSKASGPVDRYDIEGEVIRYDDKSHLALIRHGDIKNASGKVWMGAMTMEFPIKEKADIEKMKAGTTIKAGLFQRPSDLDYWIAEVQVVAK